MSLVDPVSKSPFVVSPLAKVRWLAKALSRFAITKARKAARRQDWSGASAHYIDALRLDPGNGLAWVQLGHSFGNVDAPELAQIAYLNATLAQPRLATGHRHLGLVRYKTALHEQAMQSLAAALFLNTTDDELRDILRAEEDDVAVERRIVMAALALADRPRIPGYIGVRATILRSNARAAARRGQWGEAERLYRRLTQLGRIGAPSFIQLGNTLTQQHKHGEAEQAYRRAAAADPLNADAWFHLGYALTAQEKHLRAHEAFAVVNRIAPGRPVPVLEALVEPSTSEWSTPATRRFVCPDGLIDREKAIWRRLATQIEGRA